MEGMEILKEISDWNVDFTAPNHTYLINQKGQIIAYAKHHGEEITILKSRHYLDKRYRKFLKDNHSELSKIIPQFTKEEKITIPVNTRVFKVKSKNREYQVLLKDDQYSCGCIGYGYRGKCKHIDAVAKKQHSPKGA
jgi:hypothetical protein